MRFRYFRIFFSDIVLLPVLLFCILNADLLTYSLRMLKGQMSIITNARPFEEVYADPEVADSVKAKLHLIDEIKQFAYDSIGLAHSDNYTTFFDQKDQRLMYVVTAAERFELKAYQWSFPILGDVPYKGFFDQEKAKEEYLRLRMDGYDANIGGASGWSTLGWFTDPVLSSMLKRSEADLAELIIHELTHGTIFVSDSVDYNENLAQFVGVEGAKWFLRSKYGGNSNELNQYMISMEEDSIRNAFMVREATKLDSIYKSFKIDQKRLGILGMQREKEKYFIFTWRRASQLDLKSDSSFADRLLKRMAHQGNTLFLQYVRYEGRKDDFSLLFNQSGRNLRRFVNDMAVKYGT